MKYFSAILLLFSCLWFGTEALASQSQPLSMDTVRVEILGTSENLRFDPVETIINPGDIIDIYSTRRVAYSDLLSSR